MDILKITLKIPHEAQWLRLRLVLSKVCGNLCAEAAPYWPVSTDCYIFRSLLSWLLSIIPRNLAKATSLPQTLESQLLNIDQHTTGGSPLSSAMINTVFLVARVVG